MSNKIKRTLRLSPELSKAIDDVCDERIKIDERISFPSWSSKNAFIEYLIKIGLVHYKRGRDKDKEGVVL